MNVESRELIEVEQLLGLPYDLNGKGFTAAMWDGGWAGEHKDLNYIDSKLAIGDRNENCGPTWDPTSNCQVKSHKTHVAGTMLGSGIIDPDLNGIAPNASLVSYEWPGNDSSVGLYEETENEINESINKYSAILSQNSWGYSSIYGAYGTLTAVYDSIVKGSNANVDGSTNVVFSAETPDQAAQTTIPRHTLAQRKTLSL